jgi:hypothetical protein
MGVCNSKEDIIEPEILVAASIIFNGYSEFNNYFVNKLPIYSLKSFIFSQINTYNAEDLTLIDYNTLAQFVECGKNEKILFIYCADEPKNIKIGKYVYIGCTNNKIFSIALYGKVEYIFYNEIKHARLNEGYKNNVNLICKMKNNNGEKYYNIPCENACKFFCDFINTIIVNNTTGLGIKNYDLPPSYNDSIK